VGRRRRARQAALKGSSSMLLLLIIASAALAFIPFRVTLAVGTSTVSVFFDAQTLLTLSGTHVSIDSLGLFVDTNVAAKLLTFIILNQTTGALPILSTPSGTISFPLKIVKYFAVKAQKITVDIADANGSMTGLLQPFGSGPSLVTNLRQVVEVRIVLLSMTINGYTAPPPITNKYGEDNLAGLNPAFAISFDRAFIDLFIDPPANTLTYMVQADMTVYQAMALLAEAAFLQ